MLLLWFPEYSTLPHISLLLGTAPSKAGAESTCTWISGMWGMQNLGPVVKGSLWKVLPLEHKENYGRRSSQLHFANRVPPAFIWSHPQDDYGRCAGVPTPPTSLCCLPVCSLGSAEKAFLPRVDWKSRALPLLCPVFQVRVWPLGRNRLIPTLSYHLPAMGP